MNTMRLCFGCQTGSFTPIYTNHVVTLQFQTAAYAALLNKSSVEREVSFPKPT